MTLCYEIKALDVFISEFVVSKRKKKIITDKFPLRVF
jgi:hypothetical protein